MNYERMRHAVLQILLASKRKDGQGMLTATTIAERLGEGFDDADIQYCLGQLGTDELVQLATGDDRVQAAVLTVRGEAVARGDNT